MKPVLTLCALATLLLAPSVWAQNAPSAVVSAVPAPVAPAPVMAAPTPVSAPAACDKGTCVQSEDMKVFISLLKDAKCRTDTPPTIKSDPITVVVDKEGRIYGSGGEPKPYKLSLSWCNYQIEATSQVQIVAAQEAVQTYGFRFRPKAFIGYLPIEAVSAKDYRNGIDGGVLLEPFFLSWTNINAVVGFRSFGAAVGFDPFKNMSLVLGYTVAWESWRSNLFFGVGFALW